MTVTNRVPIIQSAQNYPHVADCDYFTVDKLDLDGNLTYRTQGYVGKESFLSILILDGEGTISNKAEKLSDQKGDTFFLQADRGDWQIQWTMQSIRKILLKKPLKTY